VVVNDIGPGGRLGEDGSPASEVVGAIKKASGEAITSGEDVSSWQGAKAMIDAAIARFGKLDILINNAGILRDRMLTNMDESEWDSVIQVHLKGTFAPSRHASAYWRDESKKIGGPVKGRIINTSSTSGIYGNVEPDQLRRGQSRHRRLHHHRGPRAAALRRHRQRHLAHGADAHYGGPAPADPGGGRDPRAKVGLADRRLSGERGGAGHHRPGDPGGSRPHRRVRGLAARRRGRPGR
jgi:NAD(P)-dependent dehydrogenase (short-subunit alcohol dehydrogenase family)